MSMYDKNHYNNVISLQLIKINEKKCVLINLDSEKLYISTPLTNKYLRIRKAIHPSLTYILLLAYILILFLKAHET